MRFVYWCLWTILLALPAIGADQAWQPAGLGGSGGMFCLAVSPLEPQVMMVNCDMSGAYVSHDAGKTWRMIHHQVLQGNTHCHPVFHPTIAHRVYAANGGGDEIRVSDDDGSTWRPLLTGRPPWRTPVTFLDVASAYPKGLILGAADGVYATLDDGATWRRCEGPKGKVLGALVQGGAGRAGSKKYNFIATDQGLFRSAELYKDYARCDGLPQGRITSFSAAANGPLRRLYATLESALVDGRLAGGVYRSEDDGATWSSCMQGGLNVQTQRKDEYAQADIPQYGFISTTDFDPLRVYVYCAGTSYWPPNHSTVYRSDDGGRTWRAVLFSDPRFARMKLNNVEDDYVTRQWRQREQCRPYSMVVSRGNPDVVALCASAWLLRTDNGGRNWQVCHTGPAVEGDAGGQAWQCNGLVVTTTWNYYIDPHQPDRHYICYTDIGFARSLDRGKTWIWQAQSLPWKNTVYELAFDPEVPGRMWGAMSNTHDIPNENVIGGNHRVIMQGGVAVSDDYGITWRKLDLPPAPGLSVVVDPTSPKDRRVLYASLFEKGVYKSSDGGKTWSACNRGLGHPQNMRCCKLQRCPDGTLLVLVTGKKIAGQFTLDGTGLYRSADGGQTWVKITAGLPLYWPKDFSVKPGDPQTILVSASDARGHPDAGGLYRTSDGGRTWSKLVQLERQHFGAFYHPAHPGWIYATCTEGARQAGLYLSRDDGATWAPFKSLPFGNIQRMAFDPDRPGEIILTTFGSSILHGPAVP